MRTEYPLFTISKYEYISLESSCTKEELGYYHEVMLFFKDYKGKIYDMFDGYWIEALYRFHQVVTRALKNDLEIDKLITNIGHSYNEWLQGKIIYPCHVYSDGKKYWAGYIHWLWASNRYCRNNCVTWLYQKEKKLYFEITPTYQWHAVKEPSHENFISYDKFIQSYHTYVLRELSFDLLKEWNLQIEDLLRSVEENNNRFLRQKNVIL